jgi:chaperone BCS1
MDSLVQLTSIVQPLLALLNNTVETTLNSTFANTTQNATVSGAPLPTDFSSLMTFIYSMTALRDYVKLIVLGGALETLRRIYTSSYSNILDRFFISATFDSDDMAFSEKPFPHGLFIN